MITKEILKQISPRANDRIIADLENFLDKFLETYGINTYLRVCHFLAQAAHESDGFKTLREYWGPTPAQNRYEGRATLGNTRNGDGKRFMGRGIFQLTGRANYRQFGQAIGVDLENNPELAESPEISVHTAVEYWKNRKLNPLADQDDIEKITRKINGGLNGFEDRKKYLDIAKRIIPKNFSLNKIDEKPVETGSVVDSLDFPLAKRGDISDYVSDLQNMLIKKGANINADGNFGPKTEQAVKDFQIKNGFKPTGIITTLLVNKLMEL